MVPQKGLAHEHGGHELLQGVASLGPEEGRLRLVCDGELAIRSVQGLARRREGMMVLGNSGVGAHGVAGKCGPLPRRASPVAQLGLDVWVAVRFVFFVLGALATWMAGHDAGP